MAKTKAPSIKGWGEADIELWNLLNEERIVARQQAELAEAIDRVRASYTPGIAEHEARIADLKSRLKKFVRSRIAELEDEDGRRSRPLNAGLVGFRRTPPRVSGVPTEAEALAALVAELRKRDLEVCVKTTDAVLKTELAQLPAKTLASLGLEMKTDDLFFYEGRDDEARAQEEGR
jgi:phage host-nuclease inhibitor protein Gam